MLSIIINHKVTAPLTLALSEALEIAVTTYVAIKDNGMPLY